jgi:vancomycin resistance protein YoaR
VVTTLYNAVLYAELPVVERHNHSGKVHYADYGFDATVAGDYYDLKFKNDTPHPLLIVSGVQNGYMFVQIYGYESRPTGRSLEFKTELIEKTPPQPEIVKTDPNLPAGEKRIQTFAQEGLKYETHKYIYENGMLKEKVKINTSTYKPVQGVVIHGA